MPSIPNQVISVREMGKLGLIHERFLSEGRLVNTKLMARVFCCCFIRAWKVVVVTRSGRR